MEYEAVAAQAFFLLDVMSSKGCKSAADGGQISDEKK